MIEGLTALDRSLFLFINSFHSEALNPFMVFISGQLLWIPLIGYFFWRAFKTQTRKNFYFFCLFLVLALIASDVTSSYVFKNIFTRLRPCREIDLKPFIYSFGQKCGGRFGFVSSHAANSVALILFSIRSLKFTEKWTHALWIIPALVCWSRMYLGVHYPGDILGGVLIGLSWSYFFSTIYSSYGANR